MTPLRRSGLLLLALLLLSTAGVWAAVGHDEAQVRAAFLYNFLKFCTWPAAAPAAPLVIGSYGRPPDGALAAVAGKTVGRRVVAVRQVDSLLEAGSCQLLFIPAGKRRQLPQLLQGLAGKPVLTVSEAADFARLGGMIGLLRSGPRLRFEVNLEAARGAGLELSSQLLKLASIVWGREEQGHGR